MVRSFHGLDRRQMSYDSCISCTCRTSTPYLKKENGWHRIQKRRCVIFENAIHVAFWIVALQDEEERMFKQAITEMKGLTDLALAELEVTLFNFAASHNLKLPRGGSDPSKNVNFMIQHVGFSFNIYRHTFPKFSRLQRSRRRCWNQNSAAPTWRASWNQRRSASCQNKWSWQFAPPPCSCTDVWCARQT